MANRYLGYTDESAAAADLRSYARVSGAATVNRLPMFSGLAPTRISDSAFAQADNGRQIIVGIGATVNAGQVSPNPIIVIGDGATAWGIGAVAIGRNVTAGQTAAKDGCIVIGYGGTNNAKNGIRIGSELAFGVGLGDDAIIIGTQTTASTSGVSIGRSAHCGIDCVAIGSTANAAISNSIAIGKGANAGNTDGIAIGTGAVTNTNNNQSSIAIGKGATASHVLASKIIAIGEGATINTSRTNTIVIGAGATSTRDNEVVFGDNVAGPITLFTIRPGAAAAVKHRTGGTGEWMVRNLADTADIFSVDENAVADNMRLLLWDVTAATLKRVTRGALDSGGAGKRLLLIAN